MASSTVGEGGLAGQVHALVSQHGNDARRRRSRKARLIGRTQRLPALGQAQGSARCGAYGLRSAITIYQVIMGFPTLQSAFVDASCVACQAQLCAGMVCRFEATGQATADFEADHSSSSLFEIAVVFLAAPTKLPSRPAPGLCAAARAPAP